MEEKKGGETFMTEPILGQEAVVKPYGLGRISAFELDSWIEIYFYCEGTSLKFDPKDVRLVQIFYEDDEYYEDDECNG